MKVFKGYIDRVVFYNSSNGYGVIELSTEDEDIMCVGIFAGISQGENVEVKGEWVDHPTYGVQLKCSEIKVIPVTEEMDIERYLASGAIKGVGPTLAKRIIKKFGKDTLRIIDEEPERLVEIKGISERIAREIATQVEEKRDIREALMKLQKYGISNNMAMKLYDRYGGAVVEIIEANPYKLAEEVDGIGFKKADEIAANIGISVDSKFRIKSGIIYALAQSSIEGHVYLPKDVLIINAYEILGIPESLIENEIDEMIILREVISSRNEQKENCIYLTSMYNEELSISRMLYEISDYISKIDESAFEKEIEAVEGELNIELDELQKRAVKEAAREGVFILTGGPGTGKTTTINSIIKYYISKGYDILLGAPTGRAAKRMTEATGYEAKTIHRMLELNGASFEGGRHARFERNRENPLEADAIIIDEASMLDIHLFYALLKAIVPGTKLIIVGDDNQLPSVGPGQVLHDLIASNVFHCVELKKIFRQALGSDIVTNAHLINEGKPIALDNKSKDFFFLQRNNPKVIYKHMIELITQKLPGYVDASPMQIQVLTPTRLGMLGVEALNKILQEYINPPKPNKIEYEYGENIFRTGDKVMQVKNNYSLEWEVVGDYGITIDRGSGVFNGDIGQISRIDKNDHTLEVLFDDSKKVQYQFSDLDELELAYAVTIHKSQGSEYPAVVMPLLGQPKLLLNRNLLYTGVTRAKKCVMILGSYDTLNEMINNVSERNRYTGLAERIREVGRT